MSEKFYGKYRGTVVNNLDPMQLGRIQVMVPDVLGMSVSSWAMPCVPIAGKQQGIFVLPQIGAGVWVEFEQGEPDYPIWVGGFWGVFAEVPSAARFASGWSMNSKCMAPAGRPWRPPPCFVVSHFAMAASPVMRSPPWMNSASRVNNAPISFQSPTSVKSICFLRLSVFGRFYSDLNSNMAVVHHGIGVLFAV